MVLVFHHGSQHKFLQLYAVPLELYHFHPFQRDKIQISNMPLLYLLEMNKICIIRPQTFTPK